MVLAQQAGQGQAGQVAANPTPAPAPKPKVRVDPQVLQNELYAKAKAAHAALYLEPRHPALEGTFQELGTALKQYEEGMFG